MSPGRRPLSFSNRLRHIYQITRSDAIGSADDVGPPAVSDTSSISLTSGFLWLGVNQSVTGEYACVVSVPLIRGELQRNHQSRNDIIISRSPRFFFWQCPRRPKMSNVTRSFDATLAGSIALFVAVGRLVQRRLLSRRKVPMTQSRAFVARLTKTRNKPLQRGCCGIALSCLAYRVVQKNGATLHFPKYLENY